MASMSGERLSANNRKAFHEYYILEKIEAGLVLKGTEVKSIRAGKVNLSDAFARIDKGEMWLYHCHISPYEFGNRFNTDPIRPRKCLLHKKEILKLEGKMATQGLTLAALRLYFSRGCVKVELGLAKGKKLHDKRAALKEKAIRKESWHRQ